SCAILFSGEKLAVGSCLNPSSPRLPMSSDEKTNIARNPLSPSPSEETETPLPLWPETLISSAPPAGFTQIPRELANHPRYRIVRLLGQGGMGAVYLAEHLVMGRKVALKFIRLDSTTRADFVERFRREVRIAAQLDHPNIVRAFDAEEIGDFHVLVLEYIEGI